MENLKDYMSVPEAAEALGVSDVKVRHDARRYRYRLEGIVAEYLPPDPAQADPDPKPRENELKAIFIGTGHRGFYLISRDNLGREDYLRKGRGAGTGSGRPIGTGRPLSKPRKPPVRKHHLPGEIPSETTATGKRTTKGRPS